MRNQEDLLRSVKFGFAGLAAALLAACGGSQETEVPDAGSEPAETVTAPAEPAASEPAITTATPAMWRVSDADSEIILFGTMHLLPADLEWRTEAFETQMSDAPVTYLEADAMSPEAVESIRALVAQYGTNPPGETLSSVLGEERAANFKTMLDAYGVPMDALEPYRPWFALLNVAQVAYAKAGFNPAAGVDAAVLGQANAEGDEIRYLESAEDQILALATLDDEEMLANFDASVDEFLNLDQQIADLLAAWSAGDVVALEETIIDEIRAEAPGAYEALFTARNRNWTAQIVEMMAGEGEIFIAVGAGHLIGAESVIAMLSEEGIEAERIQ